MIALLLTFLLPALICIALSGTMVGLRLLIQKHG
jgi:hypothetical protein